MEVDRTVIEYFVQWYGYDESYNQWISASDIMYGPLVVAYNEEQGIDLNKGKH